MKEQRPPVPVRWPSHNVPVLPSLSEGGPRHAATVPFPFPGSPVSPVTDVAPATIIVPLPAPRVVARAPLSNPVVPMPVHVWAPVAAPSMPSPSNADVAAATPVAPASGPRRFDPERFRRASDLGDEPGSRPAVGIAIEKPRKFSFFRVAHQLTVTTAVLEFGNFRRTYLVDPDLFGALAKFLILKTLYGCVRDDGAVFLWPVKTALPGRRLDEINGLLHEIAFKATSHWVRLMWLDDSTGGHYEHSVAQGKADPVWPSDTLEQLLEKAAGDPKQYVGDLDHPVARDLLGR